MWMLSMVLLAIGQGPSAGLINLPASSAPSHDDRLKKSDELSIGVHASLVRVVPSDISNILIMGTFGGYCVMGNWLAFEQGARVAYCVQRRPVLAASKMCQVAAPEVAPAQQIE